MTINSRLDKIEETLAALPQPFDREAFFEKEFFPACKLELETMSSEDQQTVEDDLRAEQEAIRRGEEFQHQHVTLTFFSNVRCRLFGPEWA